MAACSVRYCEWVRKSVCVLSGVVNGSEGICVL